MKTSSHTKTKTTADGDPDHSDDTSGEESGYGDNNKWPDRYRRPGQEEEAEETDTSVRKITPSMKVWENVTVQK